ncbi:DNA ligase 4-like [Montipora capricornis]|uniref:DNA ligase 4-like n=1 Tax=Montipora capricornis TaxID=246305 RepID=UPI0035F1F3F9
MEGDSNAGVAAQVPFYDLCCLLEKISETSGTEKKKKILSTFVSSWREAHGKLHKDTSKTTDSFYSAMRLLLPQLDKERGAYGIKEVVLAKYYIDILSIGKDSVDGRKLLNYRAPKNAKQDSVADFASVAYFVLKNRCPEKGSLKIAQVNKHLDDVAQANVERKREDVKKALQFLLRNTSALEQKWLIRIIFKELKVGLSENSVFNVFHPDAVELYSVCNSLSKVCTDLHDPTIRMNEAQMSLFSPFRPMLAERGAIEEVEKIMKNQAFYIETKIDGERMQLHKEKDVFMYFSRSANDHTHTFGANPSSGVLTPHIAGCFSSSVHSCILDGEMIVVDPATDVWLSKGMNMDVKSLTTYENGYHPCFVVFDILVINDKKLANVPLCERIKTMEKVLRPRPGYFQFVERQDASSRGDVVKALNEAIDKREEGLVIKSPSSIYKPNVRSGSGWIKIKPEYVDSLSDEMDLLIVGGYFGVGRRSGMISHFMCAVAVPSGIPGQHPSVFHSFCKVGTGYTMNELNELHQLLHPYWRPFDTKKPPDSVILASGYKEKPDVWIEPTKSKIVQVKAAEIIASDKFKTGFTLRFPRVEAIRKDKMWYECLSLKELEKLKSMAEGKLTYQHTHSEHSSEPARKRRREALRVEHVTSVAEHFKPADLSSVKQVSQMFEGREFYIVNGPSTHTKAILEKKVAENGGTFTQNPSPDTYCVIAGRINVRVKNIISQKQYDVVQASWLIKCLENGQVDPWQPSDMLHCSPGTADKFAEEYDRFGDSYTQDATVESLKEVFNNVQNQNASVPLSRDDLLDVMEHYFPDNSPMSLFKHCRVYVDLYTGIGDSSTRIPNSNLELVGLQVRLYGAQITDTLDNRVTHIILDESDLTRFEQLQRADERSSKQRHFVTQDWVTQSVQERKLLTERHFRPST